MCNLQEQHPVCFVRKDSTNGGMFEVSNEVAHTKVAIGFHDNMLKSLKLKQGTTGTATIATESNAIIVKGM